MLKPRPYPFHRRIIREAVDVTILGCVELGSLGSWIVPIPSPPASACTPFLLVQRSSGKCPVKILVWAVIIYDNRHGLCGTEVPHASSRRQSKAPPSVERNAMRARARLARKPG